MADVRKDLLTSLLRDVSRSFYLTLRVLPAAVRSQIGLAYLLARATDTIADTEIVPAAERLAALERLRDRVMGTNPNPVSFRALAGRQKSVAEQVLLKRVEEAVEAMGAFSETDQALIREVIRIITSGQVLDLERFAGANQRNILSLRTDAELDDYTYRVAGCVGEFWTRICRSHLFPKSEIDETQLIADGIRFGKGLQLVNILRDLPRDLRQGRCYLPSDALSQLKLTPEKLLHEDNFKIAQPLFNKWITTAERHLEIGWKYTLDLPDGNPRVRLACAWPILIGQETLKLLKMGNPFDPKTRIKVSRPEVRKIMARSILLYPFSNRWKRLGNKPVTPA